ncbi:MAG TPA: hypothetical protein DDY53_02000 [Clostridiales bacterium]|jgi:beta-lactamase regulating signal transducer with metallopeptidase domain|nr:hypothetical protein [Clostridiales bacterium]
MFKKIYIIIFILIFMFVSFSTFVYAGDINMNLQNSNTSVESNTSSPLNALSSLPEASLGLTNILNILLIAVGILLILLAIAILIRLR